MFDSRLGELRAVAAFLERFCRETALERDACLRLNVVLEELFVNTVRHGHRGDCDAPVWVSLEARPDRVHVTYEDTAPPFNPSARLERAAAAAKEAVGGLGVLLTHEITASRDYAYLYGRNRIRLSLSR